MDTNQLKLARSRGLALHVWQLEERAVLKSFQIESLYASFPLIQQRGREIGRILRDLKSHQGQYTGVDCVKYRYAKMARVGRST